jgi:hypothetical protein
MCDLMGMSIICDRLVKEDVHHADATPGKSVESVIRDSMNYASKRTTPDNQRNLLVLVLVAARASAGLAGSKDVSCDCLPLQTVFG